MRLFAEDSSLFTRAEGVDLTHENLVKDLQTITNWAYQWKIVFNPDITKQAIEAIFSVKRKKPVHPELEDHTKHLGVYLESGLSFSKHIRGAV